MHRIQQVSAGSAAFLSPAKAGLQCRGKHALLQAAVFWIAGGLQGDVISDSVTEGKRSISPRKFFPVPETDRFCERAMELDAVVLSRYGS